MGYTNYWTFNLSVIPKGKTQDFEAKYQKAIYESQVTLAKLAEHNRKEHGSSCLSGYSAHAKPGIYGGLLLNGNEFAGKAEDFVMREHLKQNEVRDFCKTYLYDYDKGVKICLLILKYRLGDVLRIDSDGDLEGWQSAADFASAVLKRKIKVPENLLAKHRGEADNENHSHHA